MQFAFWELVNKLDAVQYAVASNQTAFQNSQIDSGGGGEFDHV